MGNQSQTNPPPFPLQALLAKETVRARVAVSSWDEAVRHVGQLLVDAGLVRGEYIAAMARVLREMGPYAVIAPGTVLLHARPEDGVIQPCMGLITLATPVPFGHSQNDPVDLVFAFGAIDKTSHIAALQQLAQLLGNTTALECLRQAQDDGQLLAAIHSWHPAGEGALSPAPD